MQWYFGIRVCWYLFWKAVWGKIEEEIDGQTSPQVSWKKECLTHHEILHKRENDHVVHAARPKIIVNLPLSPHVFYTQQVEVVEREVSIKPKRLLSKRERQRWSLFFSTWCYWHTMCNTFKKLFLVPNVFLLTK